MARLMLVLLVIGGVMALAMAAGATFGRAMQTTKEAGVPKTAQTISYVLLILLMFGVVTGWLGGL